MVGTRAALEVEYTTALLKGTHDIQDLSTVAEMGFLLSKTSDFVTTTKLIAIKEYVNVGLKVLGLEPNQVYFFEFYVKFTDGEVEHGGVMSFQTLVFTSSQLQFRPHLMHWKTLDAPATEDFETGYPIPGAPGQAVVTACRFHLGGSKVYKNEDSIDVNQVGTVRMDAGQLVPDVGMTIVIDGQFSGPVREVCRGQLSHRIEV